MDLMNFNDIRYEVDNDLESFRGNQAWKTPNTRVKSICSPLDQVCSRWVSYSSKETHGGSSSNMVTEKYETSNHEDHEEWNEIVQALALNHSAKKHYHHSHINQTRSRISVNLFSYSMPSNNSTHDCTEQHRGPCTPVRSLHRSTSNESIL